MGISHKKKIELMRSYFDEIRSTNNKNHWSDCFVCRQPKTNYIVLENIMMPICEEHKGI